MEENDVFNHYNAAKVYVKNNNIGVIGELHPKVLREHKFIRIDKVKTKLFYLELDLDVLEYEDESVKNSILDKNNTDNKKSLLNKLKNLFSK